MYCVNTISNCGFDNLGLMNKICRLKTCLRDKINLTLSIIIQHNKFNINKAYSGKDIFWRQMILNQKNKLINSCVINVYILLIK